MIVTKIRLTDWMSTKGTTEIVLPKTGYVLITGPNGHGKSQIYESVAYARSASTIRRSSPWREKTAGSILVEGFDGRNSSEPISIERSVTAGGKVSARIDGEDQATSTKATQSIEARLGSFESWVRSSVFTGDALSSFVDATDTQRKQILESFLGVDRFEPAIKLARADAKVYAERHSATKQRLDWLEQELNRIEAEQKELEVQKPTEPIPFIARLADCDQAISAYDAGLAEKVGRRKTLEESIRRLRNELEEARAANSSASTTVQVLGRRTAQLVEGDCPTCASVVDSNHVMRIKAEIEVEVAKHTSEIQTTQKSIEELRGRASKLEELKRGVDSEIELDQSKRREIERERSELEAQKARHEATESSAHEQRKRLRADFDSKDEEATAVDLELEKLNDEIAINQVAQLALSPKGVRSLLLTRSLVAIERSANRYLVRLFPGVRVKISPSRELANGSIVEEIDFRISGVADDRGFEALSTGQKKRILLAVLLAMATLARGAMGTSTLWLDEALDGLDDEGLDAVCELVREVSKEVPVVVISHREELLEKLARGAEEWFHVQEGTVIPRSARVPIDDTAKRLAHDGESSEPTNEADKPNGRTRRNGARRAAEASAAKTDAPAPRKRVKDGARSRRSERAP